MKRYSVYNQSFSHVEFDNYDDAKHFASLNNGLVWDNVNWKPLDDYLEEDN